MIIKYSISKIVNVMFENNFIFSFQLDNRQRFRGRKGY